MFSLIAALVFPSHRIEYASLEMPQEIQIPNNQLTSQQKTLREVPQYAHAADGARGEAVGGKTV